MQAMMTAEPGVEHSIARNKILTDLPYEVLLNVVQHIDGTNDLLNLSLVSKLLRAFAQHELFEIITLSWVDPYVFTDRMLRLIGVFQGNPDLAKTTKSLCCPLTVYGAATQIQADTFVIMFVNAGVIHAIPLFEKQNPELFGVPEGPAEHRRYGIENEARYHLKFGRRAPRMISLLMLQLPNLMALQIDVTQFHSSPFAQATQELRESLKDRFPRLQKLTSTSPRNFRVHTLTQSERDTPRVLVILLQHILSITDVCIECTSKEEKIGRVVAFDYQGAYRFGPLCAHNDEYLRDELQSYPNVKKLRLLGNVMNY